MKFEIKHRWSGSVLFECEALSLKVALEAAVEKRVSLKGAYLKGADLEGAYLEGADLKGAYLKGADLEGAYLKGAYLEGADLKGADLEGAYLKGAYLKGAYLEGADLEGADLEGADLKGADLEGAYLEGAYLKGAYLEGADLKGAYLEGADLEGIKSDFLRKLSLAKEEAVGLYKSLLDGRVNGYAYTGECACFVGTVAKVRGVDLDVLATQTGLKADSSSPTEKWFLAIQEGMTEAHPVVGITAGWIREWAKTNDVKLPKRKVVWE